MSTMPGEPAPLKKMLGNDPEWPCFLMVMLPIATIFGAFLIGYMLLGK